MHANLVASWAEYADGTDGAALEHLPAAVAAIFPTGPERGVYNNALLARGLRGRPTAAAIDAVEDAYDRSGIAGFAVWAHDSETDANAELTRRGYHVDTATRAMAMSLDDTSLPRPDVALAAGQWADYLALLTQFGTPDGLLAGVDGSRFEVLMALHDGRAAAAALAFDHDGDCGIYNVGTLPHARRCGLATALTALQLHNGRERGCTTASLQATPMAERIYARVGFRDLGRFLEYVRGRS
jgi:ribosomal protein S18 acetylase RimI-like enzyme